MLHHALSRALATAYIEDQQRAAARRDTMRLVSVGPRRLLAAAARIDRASSEARRASSLMPEEAAMLHVHSRGSRR